MCQRKEGENSAYVNEATRKYSKTLPVCNLHYTVIKTIEGKQMSFFQHSLVRTIKKVSQMRLKIASPIHQWFKINKTLPSEISKRHLLYLWKRAAPLLTSSILQGWETSNLNPMPLSGLIYMEAKKKNRISLLKPQLHIFLIFMCSFTWSLNCSLIAMLKHTIPFAYISVTFFLPSPPSRSWIWWVTRHFSSLTWRLIFKVHLVLLQVTSVPLLS